MKLLPFNPEKALEGHPVITRDGTKVQEILKLKTDSDQPIIGVIHGDAFQFSINGRYIEDNESEWDLFLLPQTKTMYVVILKTPEQTTQGPLNFRTPDVSFFGLYENKEQSESAVSTINFINKFQIIEIEVEI